MTSKDNNENVVLSNLKFYALLKPNEKIDQSEPLSVSSVGLFSNIYRTFTWKADRYANLRDITDTINKSFEYLDSYLKEKEKYKLKIEFILNDITKLLKDGLPNLKTTYTLDRFFTCKVDNLAEHISLKLYERNIFEDKKDDKKDDSKKDLVANPQQIPVQPIVSSLNLNNIPNTPILPPLPQTPPPIIEDKKKNSPKKEKEEKIEHNSVKVFGVNLPGISR